MKKLTTAACFTSLCIGVATLISPSNSFAEGSPQTMTETEQKVLAAVKGMTAAFHDKNIDRVMDSYEQQATIVFQPGEPADQIEQIKAGFEGFFAVNPRFDYSGHEVYVSGDIAIHIAPWNMSGETPDGQKLEQNGLSIAVLRQQPDGEWLMVIDNPHGARLMEVE